MDCHTRCVLWIFKLISRYIHHAERFWVSFNHFLQCNTPSTPPCTSLVLTLTFVLLPLSFLISPFFLTLPLLSLSFQYCHSSATGGWCGWYYYHTSAYSYSTGILYHWVCTRRTLSPICESLRWYLLQLHRELVHH